MYPTHRSHRKPIIEEIRYQTRYQSFPDHQAGGQRQLDGWRNANQDSNQQ